MRLDDGSRMSREIHVRFCESRGVRIPPATHLVVMVAGTKDDAEALWDEVAAVLAPMGLRLSEEKTRVCHIDEGFDFLVATRGRTARVSSLIGGSNR
jgi:RNA-directed DNA polymerase